MHSEQVGELAKALSLAQAAIKAPNKGKTAKAGTFSYNYADLADVIACYREPLSKNGLALTQTMRIQDGHMVLVTTLWHTSGQWIASEYPLASYTKPQEQGSAITYARRYAATAILGIAAEEDDDGAVAQAGEPVKQERKAEPVSADAAAVLMVAAELSELVNIPAEKLIKDTSSFTGKDGKLKFFTDPTKESSTKWLLSTKAKLEKELDKARYNAGLKAEVSEEIPF